VGHGVEAAAAVYTCVEAVMTTAALETPASYRMCSGGVFSGIVRFRCYPVLDSGRIEVRGVRIHYLRDFCLDLEEIVLSSVF
jgi:hypothetical protein